MKMYLFEYLDLSVLCVKFGPKNSPHTKFGRNFIDSQDTCTAMTVPFDFFETSPEKELTT